MQKKFLKLVIILFLGISIFACGQKSGKISFSGVGLQISKHIESGQLEVVALFRNSPAEIAGIKIHDRILAINEENTTNLSPDKAATLIRGPVGTKLYLTIQSPSENISRIVTIVRERIDSNSVYASNQPIQQLETEKYNLQVEIEKAKTQIEFLKKDRDQKILPLKQEYSIMYNEYYPKLSQQLPDIGIKTHEELLRNCEQYLGLCSSLNRVAKLQYYISKLDDKIKQIGANLIKLDDNVWNMERTLELSQIFTNEELKTVEQLIEETKGKIDSQVPLPEKQDIAGLEEQIFNNILKS